MPADQAEQVTTAAIQLTPALIGVGGVVVGAALVWAKDWFTLQWNQKNAARYLVVRVICILDEYADQCAKVAQDNGHIIDHQSGEYVAATHKTPPNPVFPDDIDWKSIDHRLVYLILSLPIKANKADVLIGYAFASEEAPPYFENAFKVRQYQYARLGLEAISIARQLHKMFDIPEREGMSSTPYQAMQNIVAQFEERQISDWAQIRHQG